MLVPSAIAHYHELLYKTHFEETHDFIEQATERQRLLVGDRPVCTVLRPFFLDEGAYAKVVHAAEVVSRNVAALWKILLARHDLRKEIGLTDMEDAVIRMSGTDDSPDISARLDGFLAEDQFQFVEYNADSPGGIGYGDALAETFAQTSIMAEFGKSYPFRTIPVREHVWEVLIQAYKDWGGRGFPNIAIVDWEGAKTYNEFLLFERFFVSHGARVKLCFPETLDYRGGRLYAEAFPVDLVYKRVLVGELMEKYGTDHPLFRAARERAVCVVNRFGVQMLFKKILFALLSDPLYSGFLKDAEELQNFIPWTRRVAERKTVYGGQQVDLIPFIQENRQKLVLKPSGEYGGSGVVLGWTCTEDVWNQTLSLALQSPYVVQERVPVASEIFPLEVDKRLHFQEYYFDLDPYVWNGTQIDGCGVRLSQKAILNVAAGGSAVPLFILSGANLSSA